jgi:hypothetical protein
VNLAARTGRRRTALQAGWNDAAWGSPRRVVDAADAQWYEQGYAGGLVFRHNKLPDKVPTSITEPEPHVAAVDG